MRPEDAADMPARKEQALPEAVSSLAGQGYGLGRTIFSRLISFQKLSNTVAVFFEQRRTSGINDEFFNKVTCRCGENAFWQKCVGPFCVARRSAGPGTRPLQLPQASGAKGIAELPSGSAAGLFSCRPQGARPLPCVSPFSAGVRPSLRTAFSHAIISVGETMRDFPACFLHHPFMMVPA